MIEELAAMPAAEARAKARRWLKIDVEADLYIYLYMCLSLVGDMSFFLAGLAIGAAIPMTQEWRPYTGWVNTIAVVCVVSLAASMFRWIIAPNPKSAEDDEDE